MKTNNTLIIIGAGQYGQNVKDIVLSNGEYDNVLFADDNPTLADYNIQESMYLDLVDFVIAIGNAEIREVLHKELEVRGKKLVSIVHKSAYVASTATIGNGCIIEPNVSIAANTKIGKGTIVCAGSVINHNAEVGDFCHIDVGAIISARSIVKNKTKLSVGDIYV